MALTRRLQRTAKGQYTLTVPKALVELLRLKEQQPLAFSLDGVSIVLHVKPAARSLTRRLQRTKKDQYTLTVPKALVELIGLKVQDALEFSLDGDKIVLVKNRKRGARNA